MFFTNREKNLFLNLFNNSNESIFIISQKLKIKEYNEAAREMFNLTEKAIQQSFVFCVMGCDDMELSDRMNESIKLGYYSFRYEFKMDSVTKYFRFLINEIKSETEEEDYFVTIVDESDMILTQKTTLLYRLIFEQIDEGILIAEKSGQIIWGNQALYEQSGYSMNDIVGVSPSIFKSGRQDKMFYEHMWKQILENGRYEGELWNRNKIGNVYPVLLTILRMDNVFEQDYAYIGIFKDLTQRKSLENKVYNLFNKDRLTKLYNRYYIEDAINNYLVLQKRLTVIVIEIDDFKHLNDLKGHNYGDRILVDMASKLTFVFDEGTIGRIGADEFIILLETSRYQKIEEQLYKFFLMLQPHDQIVQNGLNYTVSAGVVLTDNQEIKLNQILNHVLIAKESARKQRGNTFKLYTDEMADIARYTIQLEEALVEAVANKDFYVVYQPIHDVQKERFAGVEALIRWEHDIYGFIPPSVFIPIAEKNGLINDIGYFVVEQCCRDYPIIANFIGENTFVAINMSPIQFEQTDIAGRIGYLCSKYDLEPEMFEIEITESSYMTNIDYFLEVTNEFKKIGFSVVVDDFGTGYSSLNRLVELEIDKVKIDKSFIDKIGETKKYEELIEVIKTISSTLNLDVVAEGVEHKYQYDFIKKLGIKYVQGYYKSRPLKIEAMKRG